MSNQAGSQAELVYCHECRTDWLRARHGLECPQCHSSFVEVIKEGDDPRENRAERDHQAGENTSTPHHDFLSYLHPQPPHPPWERETPNPDEGNIEHLEWNAGPGLRFSRTSYRTSGQRISDPFGPFFQSFSTVMEGPQGARANNLNLPPDFERGARPWSPPVQRPEPGHPPRDGAPTFGSGRHTFTTTTRLWPTDTNDAPPPTAQVDQLQGILGSLLQSLNTVNGMNQAGEPPGAGGPPHFPFHSVFAQLLNPANAANGDAVYTEEALDRVISQFMEQANGSSAPGPASAEAIKGLPKQEIDKSMMGSDGKAECSVCMDSVDIGDEVTILPCRHWFHGDCIGAWLKEHDTCPHCRQGIMPKEATEGRANAPRRLAPLAPHLPPFPTPAGVNLARELHFTWQPSGVGRTMEPPPPPPSLRRPSESYRHRPGGREGRNRGEGSSTGGGSESGGRSGRGSNGGGGRGDNSGGRDARGDGGSSNVGGGHGGWSDSGGGGGGGGRSGTGNGNGSNGGGAGGGSNAGLSGWVRGRWNRSSSDRR